MSKGREYTEEARAGAMALLQAEGYPTRKGSLVRVSRQLDIPETTLRNWFTGKRRSASTHVIVAKKEDLADKFEGVAYKMLDRAGSSTAIDKLSGKDAVMAAAIATDKMRLLRGLPTEIVAILPIIQEIYKLLDSRDLKPSVVFGRMRDRINADEPTLQ